MEPLLALYWKNIKLQPYGETEQREFAFQLIHGFVRHLKFLTEEEVREGAARKKALAVFHSVGVYVSTPLWGFSAHVLDSRGFLSFSLVSVGTARRFRPPLYIHIRPLSRVVGRHSSRRPLRKRREKLAILRSCNRRAAFVCMSMGLSAEGVHVGICRRVVCRICS